MKKQKSIYNSLQEWANAHPTYYNDAIRQGFIKKICEKFDWIVPMEFEEIKVGDTICVEPTTQRLNELTQNKKIKDFIIYSGKKTFHLPYGLTRFWRLYKWQIGLHFNMYFFKSVLTEKVNKRFRKRRKKRQ